MTRIKYLRMSLRAAHEILKKGNEWEMWRGRSEEDHHNVTPLLCVWTEGYVV